MKQECNLKLIALDNGLKNLKIRYGKGEDQKIIYQNKMTIGNSKILGKNTYNVIRGKKKYTVGENALVGEYNEGKADECHIINALVGVTHCIEDKLANEKILLIYGESVNKYYDDKHIEVLKEKLQGEHNITVNGDRYIFTIENLVVLPEGCGYLFSNISKNQKIKYIIDIGGTTVNFIVAKNCVPIEDSSFSTKLGINSLVEKIRNSLIKNGYGGDLHDDEITSLIEEKYLDAEGNRIVEEAINDRLQAIERAISKNGFDVMQQLRNNGDSIEFIGGGSEILRAYIKNYFKTESGVTPNVVDGAVWSNVNGFYSYGEVVFKDRIKQEEEKILQEGEITWQ